MVFLSQALHLGSLLLPHNAFQEHAAHSAEWSAQLSSKGSERTCIRSGLTTFLHYTFTAHPDCVVKCQGIDIVHGIFGHSGDGISSTQDVDTGHDGVSRSHHRRLIDLPLHPGGCEKSLNLSEFVATQKPAK